MKIIRDPGRLNRLLKALSRSGKSIGFVPTMGALHPGHLSLIKQARRDNDTVVVSIFINPAQFGPKEDLNKYPRPLKNDLALCRKARVDLVFLPDSEIMYPEGFCTFVHVEKLANILCGATRPGHFRGVATVVAKLLNIVVPSVLYLGQKDAQQAVIIRRMVSDLNFPVKVKVMPTVREKSGLAMSSRNAYLSEQERGNALVLFRALNLAKVLIRGGAKDTVRIISRVKQLINKHKNVKIDYIAVMDSMNLKPLKRVTGNCLVALAVYIGKTRLIDNILI
ncbi:MAG: pantoate--beta-alanine ligase [Candidatus Omnitrophica bacterium]|nr:pantoate--beta-alanine ligase [Candidatus Omnitrophota bacterium]MBU4303547.1 pantoate--beta-alanine ligase [Candidatus Omnitrophota bacterium]MBU4418932.1 pantoate--beta-alanine ligase [Candidatus Omnitrophota bacterium]MBU4468406.1 pantoate--beta-alanine ligase [Candidatus Omnitrophota bacterium]MCG2708399.1 pantoate--beta-alanine ligase [Candidatus Omnitrophota bacterium]